MLSLNRFPLGAATGRARHQTSVTETLEQTSLSHPHVMRQPLNRHPLSLVHVTSQHGQLNIESSSPRPKRVTLSNKTQETIVLRHATKLHTTVQ